MARVKADKPQYNFINTDTIATEVMQCINNSVISLGYDPMSPADRKAITHNEINYCLRQVFINLFKPDKPLYNNQNSMVDYDNIELLKILADVFIDVCMLFNKSLGLMSFSYMIGCNYKTIYNWLHDEGANPERLQILQNIQEQHKNAQIGLLNNTPVGALAVANNDIETGLEWSKNQAAQITQNTVYLLPSERVDRMKLPKPD